jgi:hypothetical protein
MPSAKIPFRQLGQLGLNADTDPFSFTDPRQWTTAINCSFRDGQICRAQRFRVSGTATGADPRQAIGYGLNSGGYEYLLPTTNGSIFRWVQHKNDGGEGIQQNLTPDYWLGNDSDAPYTWAETNSVIYVNRADHQLWAMQKGGKGFEKVTGWGEYWRCSAIRSLNGQMVAVGVQKDGRDYPTMVLTSDYTTYNAIASIWTADTTNSASSNVIADMQSKLIDGCSMQDRMFLYGDRSCWVMEPTYDNFVYRYRAIFGTNAGVISQNCIIEVDSTHYVFGPTSIWKHNGVNKTDIVDGTIRRKLYDNLLIDYKYLFFGVYLEERNEIMFAFVSTDPEAKFQPPTDPNSRPYACNYAAVFNIKSETWSFRDLPMVVGAAFASAHIGETYEEAGAATYLDLGTNSYLYYTDKTRPTPLFVTRGLDVPIVKPIAAVDDAFDLSIAKYAANTTTSPGGISLS